MNEACSRVMLVRGVLEYRCLVSNKRVHWDSSSQGCSPNVCVSASGSASVVPLAKVVTWLILPVVICLSQRLSHACLSISTCTVKLRMAH